MSDVIANKTQIHSKIFISGQIIAITGLHVGGNSVSMAIGGADNVVVRNPLNQQPYIPGSSLRGKMRSLLERLYGWEQSEHYRDIGGFSLNEEQTSANAGINPDTMLGKLFGVSAGTNDDFKSKITPTRLLVRDAPLSKESVEKLKNAPNLDMPMTEVKTEVNIDRITSMANPRHFERVPAGVTFDFSMVLTLLEQDDKQQCCNVFLNLLFTGLELLQEDALGGHGSRGYGRVKLKITELKHKTRDNYICNNSMQDYKISKDIQPPTLEFAESIVDS
jgi:CRISPR-associated protein Csm3